VPVPGDNGCGMESGVDPSDEAQAPIGGSEADDARADGVEVHSPLKPRAGERGIMDISWGEQKEEGQAGAATEQGMDAIAG
jgi:hypothetical protein